MIATITTGQAVDAVGVNPSTNLVYAVNDAGRTVSVISGRTSTLTATIPRVGSWPRAVAVDPATGTIYTANLVCSVSVLTGS